ncbi:MAG: hypothetical protein GY874_13740 [Desulfobacteraceae bacterium]|nr:hypothetical protein [Desulfobacteraceae bacterium]
MNVTNEIPANKIPANESHTENDKESNIKRLLPTNTKVTQKATSTNPGADTKKKNNLLELADTTHLAKTSKPSEENTQKAISKFNQKNIPVSQSIDLLEAGQSIDLQKNENFLQKYANFLQKACDVISFKNTSTLKKVLAGVVGTLLAPIAFPFAFLSASVYLALKVHLKVVAGPKRQLNDIEKQITLRKQQLADLKEQTNITKEELTKLIQNVDDKKKQLAVTEQQLAEAQIHALGCKISDEN